MPNIKKLDPHLVNQIAAGEIIERPYAAIKELVENAIDAGASSITVKIQDSGKSFIEITDNGCGLSAEDMHLAIERYATSKLPQNNLIDIHTFGFRGEALPSIASISRMSIMSRNSISQAWRLDIHGGTIVKDEPCAFAHVGTQITVRDLFYATPARLKFLKNDAQEMIQCVRQFKALCLTKPNIAFELINDNKTRLQFNKETLEERIKSVMGKEFFDNATYAEHQAGNTCVKGFFSRPTYNAASTNDQFIFVNDRPIKDKNIIYALKVSYGDLIPKLRYPLVCIYIDMDVHDVDVNAHPAKTEVRFRDIGSIKDAVRTCAIKALSTAQISSTHLAQNFFQKSYPTHNVSPTSYQAPISIGNTCVKSEAPIFEEPLFFTSTENFTVAQCEVIPQTVNPFGVAKMQLFNSFIVAQSDDCFFIIDQHAAHERILFEIYKKDGDKTYQLLAMPDILDISPEQKVLLEQHAATLKHVGIVFEFFGKGQIMIRAVPCGFKNLDIKTVFKDVLDDIAQYDALSEQKEHILGNMACKAAIKAGQALSIPEMNALLVQMSETHGCAQCNHGRPTFIKLARKDLDTLFERH